MPETGLSISSLAERRGVARNAMSKIVNERGNVTEDLAMRLSQVERVQTGRFYTKSLNANIVTYVSGLFCNLCVRKDKVISMCPERTIK